MILDELNAADDRVHAFQADFREAGYRTNPMGLEVLARNRALISAGDPMMTGSLEIWWHPTLLVLDAKADPKGDELAVLALAPSGRWLKLTVNGGSAIPFDMLSVEELP